MPIDQLEFRYGTIAFRYELSKIKTWLEFEIENDEIRPEFDVLKPYFIKVLKTNTVEIIIFAEFNNRKLISQLASSIDLERINREIIDTVKFRFVANNFLGSSHVPGKSLLNLEELNQECGSPVNLFSTAEQLLDDILKKKKVKHYRQLRYLAERHEGAVLKIRFVLSPFSFVFLLTGNDHYHIIMETLDTEEATYIWHVMKSFSDLKQKLIEINLDLNLIRNEGRQAFLDKKNQNFSRVLHDYSDDKKGFIVWKDSLAERLT